MIVRRDAHNFIIVIVHEIWCNLNFIYFGTFKAPRTVVQNSIESVELRIKFRNKKRNNDNFRIEIFNTLNSFRPVNRYLSIYVHVSHRRRREVNNRRDKNRVVFFKKNFFRREVNRVIRCVHTTYERVFYWRRFTCRTPTTNGRNI